MNGDTSSCGCKKRRFTPEDLVGRRFSRLVVLSYDHTDRYGYTCWRCLCDCGNETTARGSSLISGLTTSCGCRSRETAREIHTTHGMTNTSLYSTWWDIKTRCLNERSTHHDRYGGRGIFICDDWRLSFEKFRDWAMSSGYEPGLTIDRIDNNDGYYPENCRWADWFTQQNNRSNSRYITYCGEIHTIAEWARLFNVNYATLRLRIQRGDMRDFEKYYGE